MLRYLFAPMFYNLMTPLTIHSVFAYRKNSAIHKSWCRILFDFQSWYQRFIIFYGNLCGAKKNKNNRTLIFKSKKPKMSLLISPIFSAHCAIQSPITTHFPFWIKFTWSRLRISMSSSSSTLYVILRRTLP